MDDLLERKTLKKVFGLTGKLYAVVIGKKRSIRYVAYSPDDRKTIRTQLAVSETYAGAKEFKKKILDECGHKDVFIKRFVLG